MLLPAEGGDKKRLLFSLDLCLLRNLMEGKAHYLLHKTQGYEILNRIICYPEKKAVLQ